MGKHTDIQGLLNARLATISPALPICYENVPFSPPSTTDAVLPQITKFYFTSCTIVADDVFTITIGTTQYHASGANFPTVMANLTGAIVGASYMASPPTITVTGASDGTPFTCASSAKTAGGTDIAGALGMPAYITTQQPYISNCFLRAFLMEGRPTQASLGAHGLNRHVGVFQVDVNAPAGLGWGYCKGLADTVCSLFKRGTTMESGTTDLAVSSSGPGPAGQDDTWYTIPVSVYYSGWAEND